MRWMTETALYLAEAIVQIFSPMRDEFPAFGFEAFHGELTGPIVEDWPEAPACQLACPLD